MDDLAGKLNEILNDIILSTLKEYNTNKTKVSDGLMTIKKYLTKEQFIGTNEYRAAKQCP